MPATQIALPEKKAVALPNGETFTYIEQGEGEIILLIHGNMSSSVHFLPLFDRLPGARLVAPDLRGFGDSSYNAGFSSLRELAEDVKLFVEALGISRAHIVAWSTGGGVAFELAAAYPELVASIFVIEGVGYKGYPLFRKTGDGSFVPYANKEELAADPAVAPPLAAFHAQNAAFFEQLWNMAIYPVNKPGAEENKLYIAETLKQRNLVDVDWALASFNMSAEHNGYNMGTGAIAKINCPISFTCAERDLVVPPATTRENAAAIKGSKVLDYKNCGHSPLVDCPDRLAADILAHVGLR
ncbi:alpha/beta hydrolase [Spirochaetia bacterium]|nr:alpha/beta hydrolase [Spirochaetia bacterium]